MSYPVLHPRLRSGAEQSGPALQQSRSSAQLVKQGCPANGGYTYGVELCLFSGRAVAVLTVTLYCRTQSFSLAMVCFANTRGPLSPSSRPFLLLSSCGSLHAHMSAYTFPWVLPSRILTTSCPRMGRNLKPCPLPPEQTSTFLLLLLTLPGR